MPLNLNPKFINRLNQAANVMANYFRQTLVFLCLKRLTFEQPTELRFNHVKGRLDVRPHIVLLNKLVSVEAEIMEHPRENTAFRCGRIILKRKVCVHSVHFGIGHMLCGRVSLIRRNFLDVKVFTSGLN